jgi:hypothetical protein
MVRRPIDGGLAIMPKSRGAEESRESLAGRHCPSEATSDSANDAENTHHAREKRLREDPKGTFSYVYCLTSSTRRFCARPASVARVEKLSYRFPIEIRVAEALGLRQKGN